jgi:hypothetical protein
VRVTVAPTITLPLESVMTPTTEPFDVCALPTQRPVSRMRTNARTSFVYFTICLPVRVDIEKRCGN